MLSSRYRPRAVHCYTALLNSLFGQDRFRFLATHIASELALSILTSRSNCVYVLLEAALDHHHTLHWNWKYNQWRVMFSYF